MTKPRPVLGTIFLGLCLLSLPAILTACDPGPSREERREELLQTERDYIQLGKECAEAGGAWELNTWETGWKCSFYPKGTSQ